MSLSKVIRNGVAGALVAALPVTTAVAAVRPNAAVPTAGSTAVAAQGEYGEPGMGVCWAAIAVIAVALAVAIWIIIDDAPEGEGSLSQG